MRKMNERPPKNFARRVDNHRCNQLPTEFPPRAARLEFVVKKDLVGAYAFDSTLKAHVVDKAPRLAAKIALHSKDIVKNLGNAAHLIISPGVHMMRTSLAGGCIGVSTPGSA